MDTENEKLEDVLVVQEGEPWPKGMVAFWDKSALVNHTAAALSSWERHRGVSVEHDQAKLIASWTPPKLPRPSVLVTEDCKVYGVHTAEVVMGKLEERLKEMGVDVEELVEEVMAEAQAQAVDAAEATPDA